MTWRKSVMFALFNVKQFVEWISIGQPRRAFLVGTKQIPRRIESECNWKTDSGADHLARFEIGRNFHDGGALALEIVGGFPRSFINKIAVGKIRGAESEINVAVFIHRATE